MLLFLERADASEKIKAQELIANCRAQEFTDVLKLLSQRGILADSVEVIEQYLDKARQILAGLPDGAGLASLTDYLSQQTERLGACA